MEAVNTALTQPPTSRSLSQHMQEKSLGNACVDLN